MEIPKICVCTAPDAATAHTSLLMVVTAGATAVGGGDFTVVSEVEFVVDVDLLVESVTIGSVCATTAVIDSDNATAVQNFL
jgi:hypothetical protein